MFNFRRNKKKLKKSQWKPVWFVCLFVLSDLRCLLAFNTTMSLKLLAVVSHKRIRLILLLNET